jgi:hypothetical protein
VIRVKIDSAGKNEKGYSWYAPQVRDVRGSKKQPDPLSVLKNMIESEYAKHNLEIFDSKEKNRFDLQAHRSGEDRYYYLSFFEKEAATVLNIFRLDLEELKKGKRFLCESKNRLDFKDDISSGKEDEGCPKKKLTLHTEILDSGDYETLKVEPDFRSFKLNGKVLNGIYLVNKVIINKNEKWLIWKRSRE